MRTDHNKLLTSMAGMALMFAASSGWIPAQYVDPQAAGAVIGIATSFLTWWVPAYKKDKVDF